MSIITDQELWAHKRLAFVAGALCATAVAIGSALAGSQWFCRRQPEQLGAPQIIRQSPSQTVARIPTRRGGTLIYCQVIVDHKANIWSVTC